MFLANAAKFAEKGRQRLRRAFFCKRFGKGMWQGNLGVIGALLTEPDADIVSSRFDNEATIALELAKLVAGDLE